MAAKTLEKNVLLEMKPDVQVATSGYTLDMLRDLLTPAEYTSLHFFISDQDVSILNGFTYVNEDAYKRWASRGW